ADRAGPGRRPGGHPARRPGQAAATQHLLVNGTALGAFAAGWAFRDWGSLRPGAGTLALEAVGVALVAAGGWLGGTLVYRNQIAVDHRYAHAGKWREETVAGAPGQVAPVPGA